MSKTAFLVGVAAAAAFLAPVAASAQQIVLNPSNVYASSGAYNSTFTADNILDAQTGVINEPYQDGSYWLNPDNGPANAFISIDLGTAYRLTSFDLFNTHNAGYNDRGTGNFSIVGSNDSTFATFTTLASGTLAAQAISNDPLDAQSFSVSNTGFYRYLQFRPTSVAVSGAPCCGANVYGLNELRVFGTTSRSAVPEPATWAMMLLGIGMVGSAMRARRRTTAAA
jgi:hypothetical protein